MTLLYSSNDQLENLIEKAVRNTPRDGKTCGTKCNKGRMRPLVKMSVLLTDRRERRNKRECILWVSTHVIAEILINLYINIYEDVGICGE